MTDSVCNSICREKRIAYALNLEGYQIAQDMQAGQWTRVFSSGRSGKVVLFGTEAGESPNIKEDKSWVNFHVLTRM